MRESKVEKRYAKSLMDLAIEQNSLEEALKDMRFVKNLCSQNKDLVLMLKSPIIKTDKKLSILEAILKNHLSKISYSFIQIITRKKREYQLPEIANEFVEQYKTYNNIVTAFVTTAVPLDASSKAAVLELVKAIHGKVEMVELVDKSIMGGIIVKVGDKQIDASVSRKFADLKQEFSKNPYIAEI
jgi:F-type H+-transporting ATPase subunit delta